LVTGTVTAVVNTSEGLKPVDPGWWWGSEARQFILGRHHKDGRVYVRTDAPPKTEKPTISAETGCQRWLEGRMKQNPDRPTETKTDIFAEAKRRFPGLSARAFKRAWSTAVKQSGATAWTTPGRPGRKS